MPPPPRSQALRRRECVRLELVELRLRDRPGVEELLAPGDLVGGGAGRGDRAYIGVPLRLLRLRPRLGPLAHALTLGDQVDEDAEEREDDHEQRPARLGPAADVMPAEQVAE